MANIGHVVISNYTNLKSNKDMDTILLRTMTLKSSITGGKFKGLTIKRILELGEKFYLVYTYYCYETINFNNEVLSMLGITNNLRILKPGANKKMLSKWCNANPILHENNLARIKHYSHIRKEQKLDLISFDKSSDLSKSVLCNQNRKQYKR